MKPRAGAWLLIVLPLLAAMALAGEDAEKDRKRLEGTWKFVSLESDSKTAPAEVIEPWRWTLKGDVITWGDPKVGKTKTSFKLDPSGSPKSIDVTALDGQRKGKTFLGIYELDGDRLKLCIPEGKADAGDQPRPEEFGGGKGMTLIVLERIKGE